MIRPLKGGQGGVSAGLNADPQERSFREEGSCKSRVCPLQAILAHVRQRFALCWKKVVEMLLSQASLCGDIYLPQRKKSSTLLRGAVIDLTFTQQFRSLQAFHPSWSHVQPHEQSGFSEEETGMDNLSVLTRIRQSVLECQGVQWVELSIRHSPAGGSWGRVRDKLRKKPVPFTVFWKAGALPFRPPSCHKLSKLISPQPFMHCWWEFNLVQPAQCENSSKG